MKSKAFLAVLVALAMLVSFGLSVKEAKADAILFPWIVKSDAVSTIVSVVNTANPGTLLRYDAQLHYQYWYKRTTANGQTELCDAVSFKRPTSLNDIVTFDAAGNINGGKALFNDPSPYGGASFQLTAAAPRRAFLIVDNNTPRFVATPATNLDGTLYGEAMVLELVGGAAWGYVAYNALTAVNPATQTAQLDFSNAVERFGEVIDSPIANDAAPVVILPADLGCTRFFMTPVSSITLADAGSPTDATAATSGQRRGNINTRIGLFVREGTGYYGGIYDNDENVIDNDRVKNIVCTSADNLNALLTEGAFNLFRATGGQGWAYVRTLLGNIDQSPLNTIADNSRSGMIVGKLEFTTAGFSIDGKSVPGTFNNFIWLRAGAPAAAGGTGTPCPGCP